MSVDMGPIRKPIASKFLSLNPEGEPVWIPKETQEKRNRESRKTMALPLIKPGIKDKFYQLSDIVCYFP